MNFGKRSRSPASVPRSRSSMRRSTALLVRPFLVVLLCNWLFLWSVAAQEAPNFDLAVDLFGTPNNEAGTYRTDFCNLSLQIVQNQLPLAGALNGVSLNVALAEGAFVNFDVLNTTEDGRPVKESIRLNEQYAGLVPDILDHICERAGCTWRNSYFPIIYSDMQEGQTFNELLFWTIDTYDLYAEWWLRSIHRLATGTNYAEKWYDGSIIMVTKKKDTVGQDEFDPWGWLDPFDWGVWFMVLATIIFSSLVYWFLEWLNPNSDGTGGDDDILEPSHIAWMTATSFAGQFEFDPQTGPARLFTFSVAFWGLLMTSAYTANLASFLVSRNIPHVRIDTVDQAIKLGRTMCVWSTTQTDLTVTADYPTYAASGLLIRTDHKGVFDGVSNDQCDIALTEVSSWDAFQRDVTVNEDCDLEVIGQTYKSVPASFTLKSDAGIRCTSLLRDVLNVYMFEMELNGDLKKLWDNYLEEIDTAQCGATTTKRRRRLTEGTGTIQRLSEHQERRELVSTAARAGAAGAAAEAASSVSATTTKLSLINMGGVFLLHCILSILSCILALIPWIYQRYWSGGGSAAGSKAGGSTADKESSDSRFDMFLTSTTPTKLQPVHQRSRARSFDTAQGSARYVDVMDLRDEINARFSRLEQKMGLAATAPERNASRQQQSLRQSSSLHATGLEETVWLQESSSSSSQPSFRLEESISQQQPPQSPSSKKIVDI